MSNHIPGPWKFYTNRGIISEVEINNVGEPIIIAHGVRYPHGYLLAAEPEMLEAIGLAIDLIRKGSPKTAMMILDEVAAKRKGETE